MNVPIVHYSTYTAISIRHQPSVGEKSQPKIVRWGKDSHAKHTKNF